MATKPHKECFYYDPIVGPGSRLCVHGRCALKSVYPMKEGPGQVFPPGVTRMTEEGKPCKPFIVRGTEIDPSCATFRSK